MISFFGNFFLYLSLVCVFLFYSGFYRKVISSQLIFINLLYIISLIPFLLLVLGFSVSDFTILNVFQNSFIDDPFFFKITSVWGSHEGSILLWIFLINIF